MRKRMFISRKVIPNGKPGPGGLHRLQAFTLFEVALALSILVLMVGALYAMVDASMRGTADLQEMENRTRETSEFLGLCRKTFRTLPATAVFQTRVVEQGSVSGQELIFRNAPGLFWWGDADNASISTIVGVRAQVGGLVSLGILQDSEDEIDSYLNGGTTIRPWLMLLTDLRNLQWRFYDARVQIWMNEWKDLTSRPAFVELTITTEKGSEKYTFWVPPVVTQ